MKKPIVLRSPHLAHLNDIGDSGSCAYVVRRKAAGWVELCSKPTMFGRTCLGHARASEVYEAAEGLVAFFSFAVRS